MRSNLTVLGREIGTFDGWDGDFDEAIYYDFIPCNVLTDELLSDDLTVDYIKGEFRYYRDGGQVYKTVDMLPVLGMVQKTGPV